MSYNNNYNNNHKMQITGDTYVLCQVPGLDSSGQTTLTERCLPASSISAGTILSPSGKVVESVIVQNARGNIYIADGCGFAPFTNVQDDLNDLQARVHPGLNKIYLSNQHTLYSLAVVGHESVKIRVGRSGQYSIDTEKANYGNPAPTIVNISDRGDCEKYAVGVRSHDKTTNTWSTAWLR